MVCENDGRRQSQERQGLNQGGILWLVFGREDAN